MCGGDVVDVAHLTQRAGTVLDMAAVCLIAGSESGEGLIEGCRLDYAVVGELSGIGSGDCEAWGSAFPSGGGGGACLDAKQSGVLCSVGVVRFVCTAGLRAFLSSFYNLPLLVTNIKTSL